MKIRRGTTAEAPSGVVAQTDDVFDTSTVETGIDVFDIWGFDKVPDLPVKPEHVFGEYKRLGVFGPLGAVRVAVIVVPPVVGEELPISPRPSPSSILAPEEGRPRQGRCWDAPHRHHRAHHGPRRRDHLRLPRRRRPGICDHDQGWGFPHAQRDLPSLAQPFSKQPHHGLHPPRRQRKTEQAPARPLPTSQVSPPPSWGAQ